MVGIAPKKLHLALKSDAMPAQLRMRLSGTTYKKYLVKSNKHSKASSNNVTNTCAAFDTALNDCNRSALNFRHYRRRHRPLFLFPF
jgi:hypothetical protein